MLVAADTVLVPDPLELRVVVALLAAASLVAAESEVESLVTASVGAAELSVVAPPVDVAAAVMIASVGVEFAVAIRPAVPMVDVKSVLATTA